MREVVINLKYGKKVLYFEIPPDNLLGIITPEEIPFPEDTFGLIESVLNTPICSPPFDDVFRKDERIAIVVSDITRYTGSEIYLPVLINRLNRIGVRDEDIDIVFALGIHRQQLPEEHRIIVGDEIYKRIKLYDHNAFNTENFTVLGNTEMGARVEINKLVTEADKVILTGTIGFHYLAGFGGGRKGIMPGVASFDSCLDLHLLAFNPPEVGGKHPMVKTALLEGNPFNHAMIQACDKLDYVFLFNTILSPTKKIIEIVAGDYLSAHQQGCDFLLKNFSPELNEKADLVIVSCGGFPKDINFIQAHKSIDYAIDILKENGVMIVLAECSNGFGNSTFLDWFKYNNLKDFERALREKFEINGQTAFSTLIKAKKVKIILISELAGEDVKKMFMTPAKSIDQAVSIAIEILGKTPSTYIIPDGGSVFPRLGKED
ncbi:MAG: nickel-dependent lactate racemase [Pseudomonadota bacterium]